ncbi:MAG: NAD-dependent epimerase/dehydratase family protein, partial [Alphaproteobacteria bacterium]
MKHALITGGAGFIGLHLARHLLRQGWRVDLVDNFMRGRRDPDVAELLSHTGVILREGDLGDPAFRESLGRNYSEVFHLAAILGVENVIDRPYDVLDANVRLTSGAIEIARRQRGLARLLFASTSEVYAGTLEHFQLPLPTPESTPLAVPPLKRPRTSYMLSKLF